MADDTLKKKPSPGSPPPPPLGGFGTTAIQWLLIIAAMLFMFSFFNDKRFGEPIPYSQFSKLLQEKKLKDLVVSDHTIHGERLDEKGGPQLFVTNRVDPALATALQNTGVQFSGAVEDSGWGGLLLWLPLLFFLPLLIRGWLGRNRDAFGGILPFGRSKAKIYMETETKVTFDDVAGVDEAKSELQEVVHFLKSPATYGKIGARMPKGILLIGPPGTGKTLLAKAVAGQAGVPFFSINGSEFVEMFVGIGAARVRDLFTQAHAKSPCIIFIDELDALGRSRISSGVVGGNDEKEQTLNQLLSELDGFDTREGIVLLAATNRPEVLDPALLRAGRFDRQVLVDRPDRVGRVAILRVHSRSIALAKDCKLDDIAGLTPGFTGADLANLVNEAALAATRRQASEVEERDFTNALERIVAGLERRNRLINKKEREVVAYHEMGHALVSSALPVQERIHKVSIIPRGIGALGYTIRRPTEDRNLMSQEELESKLAILLGGRAAEEVVFERVSTGAADDIAKATDIAKSMAMSYGMEPRLGPIAYSEPESMIGKPSPGFLRGLEKNAHSEHTQLEIDRAIRSSITRALHVAHRILRQNRAVLEDGAQLLLEKETLTAKELEPLFARVSGYVPVEEEQVPPLDMPTQITTH